MNKTSIPHKTNKNQFPRAPLKTHKPNQCGGQPNTRSLERRERILKNRALIRRDFTAYGGALYNHRNNRHRARPLTFQKTSMHLVLRSSQARGAQSFLNPKIKKKVCSALERFAKKHRVKIITWANVGNHLHFHVKLSDRSTYKAFIRALTAAIAMACTGVSRWNRAKTNAKQKAKKFWDQRPFTRAVRGAKYFQTLNDYIWINQLEGRGQKRILARFFVELTNAKIFDRKNPQLLADQRAADFSNPH